MKITKTDGPPKDVLYFDEEYKDDELDLSPQDVEDVAEILKLRSQDLIIGTIQ